MSAVGFRRMLERLGKATKMPFSVHPHMLRHACGFKLANDGHDTRALQHYSGTKISSTPFAIPSFRQPASGSSGRTDGLRSPQNLPLLSSQKGRSLDSGEL